MAVGDGPELAASYVVEITGIERTRRELAKLDGVIKEIRKGQYTPVTSVTVASGLGVSDLLVTKLDALEGRIQGVVQSAMIAGMDKGKGLQAEALRAAETDWGRSGRGKNKGGRNGPGRDDTGTMIKSIQRGVEVFKRAGSTVFTGWHGWGTKEAKGGRLRYFEVQEKGGAQGIAPANSLAAAIVPVREFLKAELGKLK